MLAGTQTDCHHPSHAPCPTLICAFWDSAERDNHCHTDHAPKDAMHSMPVCEDNRRGTNA